MADDSLPPVTDPASEHEPDEPLDRGDIWRRALFMVLFALLYGVAEFVGKVVAVVQFLIVLLTGEANEKLLRFGSSLSIYAYQVYRYLTFNSEEQPFPMSDWPDDESDSSPWLPGA